MNGMKEQGAETPSCMYNKWGRRVSAAAMNNATIAKVLYEMGEYLEAQGDPFRTRAFLHAAETVQNHQEEMRDIFGRGGIDELMTLPGIGRGIAERIKELLATGTSKDYQALKKKMPVNMQELTAIKGVGPKLIAHLYKELGVKTLLQLERAARAEKIRTLKGFGEKSEQNILQGIEFLKRSRGRAVLGFVMPYIAALEKNVQNLEGVERAVVAGSVRRRKETVGDVDLLVISSKPKPVMDFILSMKEVAAIYSHGRTKTSVRLDMGLDLDVRVVEKNSFGAALNYFTGSKEHNVALREIAVRKVWKLNEYGLFKKNKGIKGREKETMIAGKTEEELYEKLGLAYIEPELREMTGEIEAARANTLPRPIGYKDLRGDLQVQTNWSDGKSSIETMAREAQKKGLSYIAITDHTKHLTVTNGLDEKRLLKQAAEIDKAQKKIGAGFKILKGTECDILKDGTLDLSDKALSRLDVVGISVHSHFNLSREEQTRRIIRAMENPHTDILFHPTGRIINRRNAYDVDMETIIRAAKRTGTVLEINAFPDRLDLKDEYIRICVNAGVKMCIDSDAHEAAHFDYLEFGIAQARRGWAEKKDVVNTREWKEVKKFLKRR